MHKRRTIKAALTATTIAVGLALPVSTASAASAATASPQVHTRTAIGLYPDYASCVVAGYEETTIAGASYYECVPALFGGAYILYADFD
jgi:hypothetical protein